MNISKQKTVKQLQAEFSTIFEGLKIEFYSTQHNENAGSSKTDQLDCNVLLETLNPNLSTGELNLNPNSTVAEFEEEIKSRFNLNVQVFRRSNTLYLQTTSTDSWTLQSQNTKGLHSIQK